MHAKFITTLPQRYQVVIITTTLQISKVRPKKNYLLSYCQTGNALLIDDNNIILTQGKILEIGHTLVYFHLT